MQDIEEGQEEEDMTSLSMRRSSFILADEVEDAEHFTLGSSDAIGCMGISAFCLFDTAGPVNLFKLYAIAGQAFFIQYTILHFMWGELEPYSEEIEGPRAFEGGHRLLVIVACFLHIVNGISGLPFGLTTLLHFHELKESWFDVAATMPIYVIDSVVTPCCTFVVGSLYLTTSNTVPAVILNSCAVAFIDNIDNWILALNDTMNKMGGHSREETLHLPHGKNVHIVNWLICIVPVIPLGLAILMAHIGLDILKL